MGDVLDEIIDRLSPSALEFIIDRENNSSGNSIDLGQSLIEIQSIRTRQTVGELQRKCTEIKSKTSENLNLLTKLEKDVKQLESLYKCNENQPSMETLSKKIHEYNVQISEISKNLGNVNYAELFNNVESHYDQIENLRKKLREAQKKYQSYEGLPPNIEEAKKAIAELKERIKCSEKKIDLQI